MKGKAFGFLLGITIVLVTFAFISSRSSNGKSESALIPGKELFAGLPLNDVERVEITAAGSTTTLTREAGTWVVASKYGYPADFGKLRERLLKLSDLKVGQVMKVDETQKAELKITGADAGTITLSGKAGAPLASMILGDIRERPAPQGTPYGSFSDGRFVSVDGGKSVLLVGEALSDWTGDAMQWLDSELLDVQGIDITSVQVIPAAGGAFSLTGNKDGDLELADLAEGESFDPSKRYGIQSALNYLRLEDIVDPAMEASAMGFDKADRFEATTKDNILYTVQLGGTPEGGSGRYCRIAATAMTPSAPEADTAEADAPDDTPKEDPKQIAEAINAKLARWTFVIPEYKAEAMMPSRSDLIKAEQDVDLAPEEDEEPIPPVAEPIAEPAAEPEPDVPTPAEVIPPAEPTTPTEAAAPADPTPDVSESVPEDSLSESVPAAPAVVPEAEPEAERAVTTVSEGPQPQK